MPAFEDDVILDVEEPLRITEATDPRFDPRKVR
jgi:hypothetical protein